VTTIIAWAGVDRAVASLYIASDSRISWGDSHAWDQGRKTFAGATTPHIFGYWGDVLFPSVAIPTILEEIAAGVIRPTSSPFGGVGSAIRRLWSDYPAQERRDFGIIMATRRREGMRSVFELAIMTYRASTQTWDLRDVPMPSVSGRLHVAGSGADAVRRSEYFWEASIHGGTSRAVFSAFTEALSDGRDTRSGGGVQLVGLRRIGPALRFGAYYQGKRYLAGARVTRISAKQANIEWFNELFERVNYRGKRLLNAQRHMSRFR
jgi:hypothetical protein